MQFEWCILASIANYPYTSISVIRLAKAGFHYEGNANEVVCFSCKLKQKNWKSNDSPGHMHKDNAPQYYCVVQNLNMISINNDIQTTYISVGTCGNSTEAPKISIIKENKDEISSTSAREKKTKETYSETL